MRLQTPSGESVDYSVNIGDILKELGVNEGVVLSKISDAITDVMAEAIRKAVTPNKEALLMIRVLQVIHDTTGLTEGLQELPKSSSEDWLGYHCRLAQWALEQSGRPVKLEESLAMKFVRAIAIRDTFDFAEDNVLPLNAGNTENEWDHAVRVARAIVDRADTKDTDLQKKDKQLLTQG